MRGSAYVRAPEPSVRWGLGVAGTRRQARPGGGGGGGLRRTAGEPRATCFISSNSFVTCAYPSFTCSSSVSVFVRRHKRGSVDFTSPGAFPYLGNGAPCVRHLAQHPASVHSKVLAESNHNLPGNVLAAPDGAGRGRETKRPPHSIPVGAQGGGGCVCGGGLRTQRTNERVTGQVVLGDKGERGPGEPALFYFAQGGGGRPF